MIRRWMTMPAALMFALAASGWAQDAPQPKGAPPKGEEPKHREVLGLFNTFSGNVPGSRALDILPNAVTTTESFVTLKQVYIGF